MTQQELEIYHEHAFDAFCKKIIKHAAADAYRAKKRQGQLEMDVGDQLEYYIAKIPSNDSYMCYSKTYYVESIAVQVNDRMIGEALQFIVPSKRAVLLLSYFAGYSDKDIARVLGITSASVARRKKSALDRLRELMEANNG